MKFARNGIPFTLLLRTVGAVRVSTNERTLKSPPVNPFAHSLVEANLAAQRIHCLGDRKDDQADRESRNSTNIPTTTRWRQQRLLDIMSVHFW